MNTEHGKNRYISIYKSYAVESSHLTRFPNLYEALYQKARKSVVSKIEVGKKEE